MWILTLDIGFRSFAKKTVFWDSGPKFLPRCVNLKFFFYVIQASKVPRQPLKGQHLEKCEKNSKSLHLNPYTPCNITNIPLKKFINIWNIVALKIGVGYLGWAFLSPRRLGLEWWYCVYKRVPGFSTIYTVSRINCHPLFVDFLRTPRILSRSVYFHLFK